MSPFIVPVAPRTRRPAAPPAVQTLTVAKRPAHAVTGHRTAVLAPPFPFSSPVVGDVSTLHVPTAGR
jgi:hypothetical protein